MEEYEEVDDFSVKDVVNFRTIKGVVIIFAVGFIGALAGLLLLAYFGNYEAKVMVQYVLNTIIAPDGLTRWIYGQATSQFALTGDPSLYFILLITNNSLRIIMSSIGAVLFWVSVIGLYKYYIEKDREGRNLKLYIIGIGVFVAEYIIFDDQFTISALILMPLVLGGLYMAFQKLFKIENKDPFTHTFLKISIYSVLVAELLIFVISIANYFVFVPPPFTGVTDWFVTIAPHLFIELGAIIIGCAIGLFIATDLREALKEDGIEGFLEEGEAILENKTVWKALAVSLCIFLLGGLIEAYFSIGYLWPNYGSYAYFLISNLIWDVFLNWGPVALIAGVIYLIARRTNYWPIGKVIIYILAIEGLFLFFTYITSSQLGAALITNPDPQNQSMVFHFIVMALFFSGNVLQDIGLFSVLILFGIIFKLILDYRKKNVVYTGSTDNPLKEKDFFEPFRPGNEDFLKKLLFNAIFPLMPMILLAMSIQADFAFFELNIILFVFMVWRFRGTMDSSMSHHAAPQEIDTHGNVVEKDKTKFSNLMDTGMKLYYIGMLAFNAYSIFMLISTINTTAALFSFMVYVLYFLKNLVLAIFILPFLIKFGSILLIKARSFIMKIKVNIQGAFSKSVLYAVPISIMGVGILIGLSFLTTLLMFGTINFNDAIAIIQSFNSETTYVWRISFWLALNVVNYLIIFAVIGYVCARVSLKYKMPKVYLTVASICLSFPVMWILLPATHYLVSGNMAYILSGNNYMLTMFFTPIIPAIPDTISMTPWLLLNSAMAGMWGVILFVPVFVLVTVRSFALSFFGVDFAQGLGTNYFLFPSVYYQNFIFLLNFSMFLMGAIIIAYYVYFVKKMDKKRRRRKKKS